MVERTEQNLLVRRAASFSDDLVYRYELRIIWDGSVIPLYVIGLNPSTADEFKDDPTIRKCRGFAMRWGFGGLVMLNLFAFRATDPKVLRKQADPIGPDNDGFLLKPRKEHAVGILAAWGQHGAFRGRCYEIAKLLNDRLSCLRTRGGGHPEHPLYVPYEVKPKPFSYSTQVIA